MHSPHGRATDSSLPTLSTLNVTCAHRLSLALAPALAPALAHLQRRLATDFPVPEPNTIIHPAPLLNYLQCRSEPIPESELPVNGSELGCLSVREDIMAFDIYYNNMATHSASSRR
jgi:hypothetical protein